MQFQFHPAIECTFRKFKTRHDTALVQSYVGKNFGLFLFYPLDDSRTNPSCICAKLFLLLLRYYNLMVIGLVILGHENDTALADS